MKLYHTINTRTGVIVQETNRHPLLQPLRRSQSPRSGLAIKRRYVTRNEREVFTVSVLVVIMVLALSCWSYAFLY